MKWHGEFKKKVLEITSVKLPDQYSEDVVNQFLNG